MSMEIAFCIGKHYFQHLFVSVTSMLQHNSDLRVWVIHDGLQTTEIESLSHYLKDNQCEMTEIAINGTIFDNLIKSHHFSNANYYRLLIPNLLPSEIKEVLYLDADLLVLSTLRGLFNLELNDYCIAAVECARFDRHKELRMNKESNYFNSGVMLINIDVWKRKVITKKVIDFTNKYPERIHFADQCGLNAIINGKWFPLHPKYNLQTAFLESEIECNTFSKSDMEEAKRYPSIIHYTGSSKPWQYMNRHPYKHEYWKYLEITPFSGYKPKDYSIKNVIEKYTPGFLIKPISKMMRK